MKVSLVGRTNVGKSSLFNRLISRRAAIVSSTPGQTRDVLHGEVNWCGRIIEIMDTGGYLDESPLAPLVLDGMIRAASEADVVLFVVDGRTGLTAFDKELAERLRRLAKPVVVAVNKIDNYEPGCESEGYELGFEEVVAISAMHGSGTGDLLDEILKLGPEENASEKSDLPRICIVGRPNAGKSTLLNLFCGSQMAMVHETPGTTRDPVEVQVNLRGHEFILVDTAGLRRKMKMDTDGESGVFDTVTSSLEKADGCIMLIDSATGVGRDDARIASYIEESGAACVIGLNKSDAVDKGGWNTLEVQLERLEFVNWARKVKLSGLKNQGIDDLLGALFDALEVRKTGIPDDQINILFEDDLVMNPPPRRAGGPEAFHRLRMVSTAPPVFTVYCTYPEKVHFSWKRHLVNILRNRWNFEGNPVYIKLKASSGGKKNKRFRK